MSKLELYNNTYNDASQMQQDLTELFPLSQLSVHPESSSSDNQFRISWDKDVAVWRTNSKTGFQAAYLRNPRRTFELHFVKAGHCIFETDEDVIDAPAGTALLFTKARRVNIKAAPGACKISIAISYSQFAAVNVDDAEDPETELAYRVKRADLRTPGLLNIEQLATILLGEEGAVQPHQPFPLSAQHLRDTLILMFMETWPRLGDRASHDASYSPTLKRALKWMNAHLGETFTIGELARESGASIRTLQSAFKEELGTGPNAYLLKLRLQQAHKDLLDRQTHETIGTIARRWGFHHLGYFASQYRKLYGKHPSSVHKDIE
jgi:AraC-like DNA-binding protein